MSEIDYKGLNQHFSKSIREPQYIKRGDQPAVAIYMLPILQEHRSTLHCLYCGHPIIEVRNQTAYISPYPAHGIGKVSSDEIICKRCKQRYIKIV